MGSEVELRISGLQDARAALSDLPKKLRRTALRNALKAAARIIQAEARRRVPVLKLSTRAGFSAQRRGVRKVGTLKRAISVRTSKFNTRQGDVGVFVNVRPLKSGGAKNPNDPYYWRWQEFGWNPASTETGGKGAAGKRNRRALNKRFKGAAKRKPGANFMRSAASKLPQALQAFEQSLGPQVQRFQTQGARA
jgi:HK97 gp10 family phage protein